MYSEDAILEIDKACTRIVANNAAAIPGRFENLQTRSGLRKGRPAGTGSRQRPASPGPTPGRRRHRLVLHGRQHLATGRSRPRSRRAPAPRRSPTAWLDRCRRLNKRYRRRHRRYGTMLDEASREVPVPPSPDSEKGFHPLRGVLDASSRFECRHSSGPLGSVGRVAGSSTRFPSRPLVESLAGLLSDPAAIDERPQDGRKRHLEVCGDVADDVEPCDVHRPERRALGAAERRPCDCVNVLDGVLADSNAFSTCTREKSPM